MPLPEISAPARLPRRAGPGRHRGPAARGHRVSDAGCARPGVRWPRLRSRRSRTLRGRPRRASLLPRPATAAPPRPGVTAAAARRCRCLGVTVTAPSTEPDRAARRPITPGPLSITDTDDTRRRRDRVSCDARCTRSPTRRARRVARAAQRAGEPAAVDPSRRRSASIDLAPGAPAPRELHGPRSSLQQRRPASACAPQPRSTRSTSPRSRTSAAAPATTLGWTQTYLPVVRAAPPATDAVSAGSGR